MIRDLLKPLLRLFTLVLALTIGFTLLISRQQSADNRLDIYRLHDCQLPCWIGIVPGKTTIGESLKLIENTYPSSEYDYSYSNNAFWSLSWFTVTRRKDGHSISVNFNPGKAVSPNTAISQIEIMTDSADPPSLSDWMDEFGVPPQALAISWVMYWTSPNVLYYNQELSLTLQTRDGSYAVSNPDILVYMIDIYASLTKYYPQGGYNSVPWQGWTTNYEEPLIALMRP